MYKRHKMHKMVQNKTNNSIGKTGKLIIGGGKLIIDNKTNKIDNMVIELNIAKTAIALEGCILRRRVMLKTVLGDLFGYDNIQDIKEVPMSHHINMLENNLNLMEPLLKVGEYIIKKISNKQIKLNSVNFHKQITDVIKQNKSKLNKNICMKDIKFPKLTENMYNMLQTNFQSEQIDYVEELMQKIILLKDYMREIERYYVKVSQQLLKIVD